MFGSSPSRAAPRPPRPPPRPRPAPPARPAGPPPRARPFAVDLDKRALNALRIQWFGRLYQRRSGGPPACAQRLAASDGLQIIHPAAKKLPAGEWCLKRLRHQWFGAGQKQYLSLKICMCSTFPCRHQWFRQISTTKLRKIPTWCSTPCGLSSGFGRLFLGGKFPSLREVGLKRLRQSDGFGSRECES